MRRKNNFSVFIIYIKEKNKIKILFATKNSAKIKRYAEELRKRDIEVLTIKDLDIDLNIEENGKNKVVEFIINNI